MCCTGVQLLGMRHEGAKERMHGLVASGVAIVVHALLYTTMHCYAFRACVMALKGRSDLAKRIHFLAA